MLGRCARGDAVLAPVAESGERMSQQTVGIVGNRNLARTLSGEAPSFRRGRTVTVFGAAPGGLAEPLVQPVEVGLATHGSPSPRRGKTSTSPRRQAAGPARPARAPGGDARRWERTRHRAGSSPGTRRGSRRQGRSGASPGGVSPGEAPAAGDPSRPPASLATFSTGTLNGVGPGRDPSGPRMKSRGDATLPGVGLRPGRGAFGGGPVPITRGEMRRLIRSPGISCAPVPRMVSIGRDRSGLGITPGA